MCCGGVWLQRQGRGAPAPSSLLFISALLLLLLLLLASPPLCDAFNLDVDNPAVYSGPDSSYFGYSVDFYLADSSR